MSLDYGKPLSTLRYLLRETFPLKTLMEDGTEMIRVRLTHFLHIWIKPFKKSRYEVVRGKQYY